MRLISWNVNKRVREGLARQVAALQSLEPDVVGLQEITATTSDLWLEKLTEIGLGHAVSTLDLVPEARTQRRPSRSGVLLASRWPFRVLRLWDDGLMHPERQVSCLIQTPHGEVEVHVVHVPSGGRMRELGLPWAKAETFELIYTQLARRSPVPRVLCGDFNAPLDELPDGTVLPWGPDKRTKAAELGMLTGLVEYDLLDVYRSLHGYGERAPSWHGSKRGYRLDHVLASRALRPSACRYIDALRTDRLSDHAPVEAVFDWTGG
jgi:exonuclease III